MRTPMRCPRQHSPSWHIALGDWVGMKMGHGAYAYGREDKCLTRVLPGLPRPSSSQNCLIPSHGGHIPHAMKAAEGVAQTSPALTSVNGSLQWLSAVGKQDSLLRRAASVLDKKPVLWLRYMPWIKLHHMDHLFRKPLIAVMFPI